MVDKAEAQSETNQLPAPRSQLAEGISTAHSQESIEQGIHASETAVGQELPGKQEENTRPAVRKEKARPRQWNRSFADVRRTHALSTAAR